VGETSVAAGVRRVFAATGENAIAWVRETEGTLERIRGVVKAQGADVVGKVERLASQARELEKKVAELEKRLLEGGGGGGGVDAWLASASELSGVKLIAKRVPDGTQPAALRELAEKLRDRLGGPAVVVLGAAAGDKAMLTVMVSKDATARVQAGALVKALAAMVGGSGGGRPDMAQAGGTDVGKLDEALARAHEELARALG
jgi:alanyl-tRNA synthetase